MRRRSDRSTAQAHQLSNAALGRALHAQVLPGCAGLGNWSVWTEESPENNRADVSASAIYWSNAKRIVAGAGMTNGRFPVSLSDVWTAPLPNRTAAAASAALLADPAADAAAGNVSSLILQPNAGRSKRGSPHLLGFGLGPCSRSPPHSCSIFARRTGASG